MDLPFVPIARRDFKVVVSPTQTVDIVLAMSAPYRPSNDPAFGPVACMILDCDDPAFAREICGNDEIEAMEFALIHFDKLIDSFLKDNSVQLLNGDGSPFQPSQTSLYVHYMSKAKWKKGPNSN